MAIITSTYLRRLMPAALLAATAALGVSGLGEPALAGAAPKEFDIGGYEDCEDAVLEEWAGGKFTDAEKEEMLSLCCDASGGVWKPAPVTGDCVAPPAAQTQPGLPGAIGPGAGVATQPPPPPPVVRNPGVTQPFTPAPASPR